MYCKCNLWDPCVTDAVKKGLSRKMVLSYLVSCEIRNQVIENYKIQSLKKKELAFHSSTSNYKYVLLKIHLRKFVMGMHGSITNLHFGIHIFLVPF